MISELKLILFFKVAQIEPEKEVIFFQKFKLRILKYPSKLFLYTKRQRLPASFMKIIWLLPKGGEDKKYAY